MRIVMAGVLALVLAACTHAGFDRQTDPICLTIAQFPEHRELGRLRLPADGNFSLSFIHSVSRTPVRDDYHAVDGRIIQTAETFMAHGTGLPSGIDEPDVTGWQLHDGRFIIRMTRPISRLIVRTDRNYRNRLIMEGREINLNQWEDQALEMAVIPCTAVEAAVESIDR